MDILSVWLYILFAAVMLDKRTVILVRFVV